MASLDDEVLIGRRAFPKAQELLAGVPLRRLPERIDISWYGTEIHPEQGAFAVIRQGGALDLLDGLLGEVLRVTVGARSVFVYVIGARGVPTEVALSRRAFLALTVLSRETVPATIEVV